MVKSFLIPLCFSALILLALIPSSQSVPSIPNSVLVNMASREMRYHHFLFHNLRNLWNQLDSKTQATIKSYGWAPPRPSKDKNGKAISTNNAGEDFLYMHRKMIAMFNGLMKKAGASPISGFTSIPAVNDKTWPMPPNYNGPNSNMNSLLTYYKANSWLTYAKKVESNLKNPAFLRTLTLGELGTYIEFTSDIHQGMHFRFSKHNNLMRVKSSVAVPYVDKKWDVVSDDWLVDLYSSQVNNYFWGLHGWIDDRINDWQKANNIKTIQWKGTWVGGNLDSLPDSLGITPNLPTRYLRQANGTSCEESMGMSVMNITAMEAVAKVLIEKGIQCEYYSDLNKKTKVTEFGEAACKKKN